jgi:hypothetical protein
MASFEPAEHQGCRQCYALRARLATRESALAQLTGRLLELERGQPGGESEQRAQAAEARASAALDELERLRATKWFRWSIVPRSAWSRMRRAGP